MQEIFYEESSTLFDTRAAKTKYLIFKVLAIISLIIGIITIFIFLNGVNLSNTIEVIFFLLIIISAFFFFILYMRKKDTFFTDYDYTFVSGNVRISKVINNKRRRLVITFNTTDIIKLGKYNSENYLTLEKDTTLKKIIATSNNAATDNKEFYYIFMSTGGIKYLIVFECTEKLMYHILKQSSKTILEDDFK